MKTDYDLMCLHDGEIDPTESRAQRANLSADPHAATKLQFMGQLGDSLRAQAAAAMEEAPTDAMWQRIAPALATPVVPMRPPLQGYLWSAAAGAALAAAATVLLMRGLTDVARSQNAAVVTPPTTAPFVMVKASPPEVESLDVPTGSGAVFTLQDEDGSAAVIWISHDESGDPL